MRALDPPNRTWTGESGIDAAVDVLSEQFGRDTALWEELARTVRDAKPVARGAFMALARARPSDDVLLSRAREVLEKPSGQFLSLVVAALCVAGEGAEILSYVDRYWGTGDRSGTLLLRPLVDRVIRDPSARSALEARVLKNQSNSESVAISIALAAAGPLHSDIKQLLGAVLEQELSTVRPSGFTFDARFGTTRSIATVIVELLQQ